MTAKPNTNAVDDSLNALISNVLLNLLKRLPNSKGIKSVAVFAQTLSDQAHLHEQSEIWRTTATPPRTELNNLATRLRDVSYIAHELARGDRVVKEKSLLKTARKASRNRSIPLVARHCLTLAKQRSHQILRRTEQELSGEGISVSCQTRSIQGDASPYWPSQEVAVLVDITNNHVDLVSVLEKVLTIARKHIQDEWPFRVVPVFNTRVLTDLAIYPSQTGPLPDTEFEYNWQPILGNRAITKATVKPLDEGTKACAFISMLLDFRHSDDLLHEERTAITRAIETVEFRLGEIEELAESRMEHWVSARKFLYETQHRLAIELDAHKELSSITNPLWQEFTQSFSAGLTDYIAWLTAIRIDIFLAEARTSS